MDSVGEAFGTLGDGAATWPLDRRRLTDSLACAGDARRDDSSADPRDSLLTDGPLSSAIEFLPAAEVKERIFVPTFAGVVFLTPVFRTTERGVFWGMDREFLWWGLSSRNALFLAALPGVGFDV